MDELFKTHKDVTYGWVLWLQEALARRRAVREARTGRSDNGFAALPGGLDQLSSPH